MTTDRKYMERAISLARNGLGLVSPNPMVGAVIVHDGCVIGEGWHRCYGQAHAEVNAVNSVRDRALLRDSTIYVTLEPCSHYGKTPPCSKLLVDCGIPHVVVGSSDPFDKVAGRGVAMLRDSGVDVEIGFMEQECRDLNPFFMTAHSCHRPWVTLKWAQSADGYIDRMRSDSGRVSPVRFSTPATTMLVHRLRSLHDAILVGSGTMSADHPSLTVRDWPGRSPIRFVADRRSRLSLQGGFSRVEGSNPGEILSSLYASGVTSVLIEGGAELSSAFLESGLVDMVRVETATHMHLGAGVVAPSMPWATPARTMIYGDNRIDFYGRLPWFV